MFVIGAPPPDCWVPANDLRPNSTDATRFWPDVVPAEFDGCERLVAGGRADLYAIDEFTLDAASLSSNPSKNARKGAFLAWIGQAFPSTQILIRILVEPGKRDGRHVDSPRSGQSGE